ncbi:MAG TPA: hypothetical protein VG297_14855 [Bryobacteraceae bacterium]|nr:hypothetical protein [Bryobacteraceae bacterium]
MIWMLIIVSALYGWVAAMALRRFSNRALVRATINRIVAHLMELELFIDSPALVFRAQRDLVRENLRLLRLVLPAGIIPAAIFVLFFPQFDAVFGHAPLRIGERGVVSATAGDVQLEAPVGIMVETPAVNDVHDGKAGWRVRPIGKMTGELQIHYSDGHVVARQIVAGSGWIDGWRLPFTRPAIDIPYPRRDFYGLHWTLWFFPISLAAAIAVL